jgi:hypothetical protein
MTGRTNLALAPVRAGGATTMPLVPAILPREPSLPPGLAVMLDRITDPDPERRALTSAHHRALTTVERDAALAGAARYDQLLAPVLPATVAAWLAPVNAAVRNPQGADDFAMRSAGIAELVADLPGAAFTSETRRRLRADFFPSADDVRQAVAPEAARWAARRDALRAMAERAADGLGVPRQASREALSQAEVDASLRRLEGGPRDRWLDLGLAQLQRRMKAEAPELLDVFGERLGRLVERERPAETAAEPRRPKPAYLTGAALAAMRARVAKGPRQ